MKIGVFDSGVGGRSFITALQNKFPDAEVVYKEDRDNLPYGDKTPQQLLELTLPIFRAFEVEGCDGVLVACNSVTTNCINELRSSLSIPLVGVEPMIKPAALRTRSNSIAVCATPATLKSKRYAELKQQFASGINVYEPDCSDWTRLIENNEQDKLELKKLVTEARRRQVDVIVLGCTHYHWIEVELQRLAGESIAVIQPIEPVLNQLQRVLTDQAPSQ